MVSRAGHRQNGTQWNFRLMRSRNFRLGTQWNFRLAICADTLYNISDSQPRIPKEVFVELLHSATSTVEFSFDNTIYRQIDGVAMGTSLGSALADIFVGYYEEKLFSEISKPAAYFRYVDHTFVIFQNEKDSEEFLIRLKGLHFSLQFTFEKENNSLPFLDVHVEHTKGSYEPKVYRKPTFTGQYLRWESFTPIKRLVQSELCVTFPRSIGFVDVTTASLPSETDIHESPDLAFSFPL